MIDSAVTWARDHRIDSFRFDLMGHQPAAAMRQLQREVDAAAGRRVPLLGEGWNFGEVAEDAYFPQARQGALCGDAIGTFSDRSRDALRGGSAGDAGAAMRARQGWINGLHDAPNGLGPAPSEASRAQLLQAADLLRAGLAGTLRDYPLPTAAGDVRPLAALDYNGMPAGYACQPDEVVNYVENHDNQTLWDLNAMRLPAGTPSAERARLQVLALAYNALSQGVAYFHAGGELLRSKSLDRNSFNSGDHFNAYDPGGGTHAMGRGLPPAEDNAASWDAMRPVLLDPTTRATPDDIAFARAAFEDWLRIRASTRLLRLRSADDVIARLRFHGTGPDQAGTLLVGELDGGVIDGRALEDAGFGGLVYLLNVADAPASIAIPGAAGRGWRLHPVLAAPGAADARAREEATVDDAAGRFSVPARTAVVFVRD
jgi:pullulanase-type alpha-1,6-glucosidase